MICPSCLGTGDNIGPDCCPCPCSLCGGTGYYERDDDIQEDIEYEDFQSPEGKEG